MASELGLERSLEHTWQAVVLFLVHLLLADNLLADPEVLSGPLEVALRSGLGRVDTGLDAAVTSTRGGNIRPFLVLRRAPLTLLRWVSSCTTQTCDMPGGLGTNLSSRSRYLRTGLAGTLPGGLTRHFGFLLLVDNVQHDFGCIPK